jgi:glucose-6-phosphate dehydrogenase assembly protein OpcA
METKTDQPGASAAGVDLAAVEREMSAFWQQLGQEAGPEGGVIRASVLNLVAYAGGPAAAREADDVLIEVTLQNPSRALLLVADAEGEPSVSAQVLARCTLPTGNAQQVCCEQVTLRAAGARVKELPSLVAPLLLSDLPTFLCWFAPPALGDGILRRLADLADRVVLDFARSADARADLEALARLLAEGQKRAAYSDLEWSRLTPWRTLLAGFYDVADYRAYLARVSRVTIAYTPSATSADAVPPGALLLAAWLASRLRWRLTAAVGGASPSFDFSRAGGAVRVRFDRAGEPAAAGAIKGVALALGGEAPGRAGDLADAGGGRAASFEIRQGAEEHWLTTDVRLGGEPRPCHLCSREPLSTARLLADELEILGPDRVYEQAVIMAGAMIRALRNELS